MTEKELHALREHAFEEGMDEYDFFLDLGERGVTLKDFEGTDLYEWAKQFSETHSWETENQRTAYLTYVGMGDFHMPAYKDRSGKYFLDINNGNGIPDLYSSSNNYLDGEPNEPISKFYDIVEFNTKYEPNMQGQMYAMLHRLKMDCNYALAAAKISGKLCLNHLYYHDVAKQIEEMRRLYDTFAEEDRPEWLSSDDIAMYEDQLHALEV